MGVGGYEGGETADLQEKRHTTSGYGKQRLGEGERRWCNEGRRGERGKGERWGQDKSSPANSRKKDNCGGGKGGGAEGGRGRGSGGGNRRGGGGGGNGGSGSGGDGEGRGEIGGGGLKALYLNAQSLLSKLPDLEATACDIKPDLILVTESWCNEKISDNIIKIKGYEIVTDLRKDRADTTNGIGGGLLVYARTGLVVLSIDQTNNFNQYVNFKIKTSICDLNVFLIYRPPSCTNENNLLLCDIIKNAPKDTLIVGDLNYPNINWNNMSCDNFSRDFMNSCIDNNFTQYIDFPTHNRNNILDLVLSNNDCVVSVDNLGPLSNSDHVMLLIHTCIDFWCAGTNEVKLNWAKANYDQMKNELATKDWTNILTCQNIENDWNCFKNIVNDVIKTNVPIVNTKNNSSKPIWMNGHINRLQNKKRRLYKKMKLTNSEYDISLLVYFEWQRKKQPTLYTNIQITKLH